MKCIKQALFNNSKLFTNGLIGHTKQKTQIGLIKSVSIISSNVLVLL